MIASPELIQEVRELLLEPDAIAKRNSPGSYRVYPISERAKQQFKRLFPWDVGHRPALQFSATPLWKIQQEFPTLRIHDEDNCADLFVY